MDGCYKPYKLIYGGIPVGADAEAIKFRIIRMSGNKVVEPFVSIIMCKNNLTGE